MSIKTLKSYDIDFKTSYIITNENNIKNDSKIIDGIQNVKDMSKDWDALTENMMLMVYILILMASILAVVVIYNLSILTFNEIERDFATLKIVGFKSKYLRKIFLTQNLFLTFVGYLIGIPLGKWILDVMIEMSGDSMDMISVLHFPNLVISFIITFILSISINLVFSRIIKNVDMVKSLKGVE